MTSFVNASPEARANWVLQNLNSPRPLRMCGAMEVIPSSRNVVEGGRNAVPYVVDDKEHGRTALFDMCEMQRAFVQ